jgi:predicted nucleic acid-binding protein
VALTRLIDTSVISRLSAGAVRAVVEPSALAGQLGRAGVTDLEVGYCSRKAHGWDLSVLELVETTADHVRRARQVQRLLAAGSQRGRKIPDLLIAAAAEELDLVLLHYDGDFDLIASVTGQRCEWVAPAGSID